MDMESAGISPAKLHEDLEHDFEHEHISLPLGFSAGFGLMLVVEPRFVRCVD